MSGPLHTGRPVRTAPASKQPEPGASAGRGRSRRGSVRPGGAALPDVAVRGPGAHAGLLRRPAFGGARDLLLYL